MSIVIVFIDQFYYLGWYFLGLSNCKGGFATPLICTNHHFYTNYFNGTTNMGGLSFMVGIGFILSAVLPFVSITIVVFWIKFLRTPMKPLVSILAFSIFLLSLCDLAAQLSVLMGFVSSRV